MWWVTKTLLVRPPLSNNTTPIWPTSQKVSSPLIYCVPAEQSYCTCGEWLADMHRIVITALTVETS